MKNGNHCFVVKSYESIRLIVWHNQYERHCDVSQLSESLFCISGEFAEIWDCNNVAKPLRVITFADLGDVEERDNFGWKGVNQVVARSGFLLQREKNKLSVIHGSSNAHCISVVISGLISITSIYAF
ncbi:hypothetical protein Pelo_19306 [Pelomyxa schiedti]|nr:hypothetical protein Pelo_19306 [Pelomyxa schiedti]